MRPSTGATEAVTTTTSVVPSFPIEARCVGLTDWGYTLGWGLVGCTMPGMNLMDIRTKDWSAEALKIAAGDTSAEELADKLGSVVPSHSVVGKVAPFFRARYTAHAPPR